jgi:hypothetical protein
MELQGRNIIVIAVARANDPDDCRLCGQQKEAHTARTLACRVERGQRQPRPRYSAIGWHDYATLGLSVGCFWDFLVSHTRWFDALTLGETIERLIERQPLIVSYQGCATIEPLLWDVFADSPEGATARELGVHQLAAMHDRWIDLWDGSYDLLQEILAGYPDLRFHRTVLALDQLTYATLGLTPVTHTARAARLWATGYWAHVLNALVHDVAALRELLATICAGQLLTLGNGQQVLLPIPPQLS